MFIALNSEYMNNVSNIYIRMTILLLSKYLCIVNWQYFKKLSVVSHKLNKFLKDKLSLIRSIKLYKERQN